MTDIEKCPQCGGELERDEADVGVGVIYGPAGCPACFWTENPVSEFASASPSAPLNSELPYKPFNTNDPVNLEAWRFVHLTPAEAEASAKALADEAGEVHQPVVDSHSRGVGVTNIRVLKPLFVQDGIKVVAVDIPGIPPRDVE